MTRIYPNFKTLIQRSYTPFRTNNTIIPKEI
nr:MAG TPA: hypothetical protein [Caudoviricetes sp.]